MEPATVDQNGTPVIVFAGSKDDEPGCFSLGNISEDLLRITEISVDKGPVLRDVLYQIIFKKHPAYIASMLFENPAGKYLYPLRITEVHSGAVKEFLGHWAAVSDNIVTYRVNQVTAQ